MIFQGLFNILDLFFREEELFYNNIEHFFREKITSSFGDSQIDESNLNQKVEELTKFLVDIFVDLDFDKMEIETEFLDPFLEIRKDDRSAISSVLDLYEKKFAPIIYEILLEKIVDYLVDVKVAPLILKLKSNGFLPIEFIMELRNLKTLIEKYPDKRENLRKYIQIQEKIIGKFKTNKQQIESLEDLKEPQYKLQLFYLIYRIINFFHLQNMFDFSHIKTYLEENVDEWLIDVPLVSLKNPDIYFCGIYLAKHLSVKLPKGKVKEFLTDLIEEALERYESLIIEATDGSYYYFKSTELMKMRLEFEEINNIIKSDPKFFESDYLKNLETSQLVVILKLYQTLGIRKLERETRIINEEIEHRISREGIKQFREGFESSEATYYVLFNHYMNNRLAKLKDYDLLSNIVSRIYRNLELLDFSIDTNYDLVSELFYSIESLKLFNCIETKEMIIHLANYLFPQEIVDTISASKELVREKAKTKYRHLHVDKTTGETIYT
jgi:hypothetical protein